MQIWLAMHLCPSVKGKRLDNLLFFLVPWRFCNCYDFFLVFEILNFRQINSTQLCPLRARTRYVVKIPIARLQKPRHAKPDAKVHTEPTFGRFYVQTQTFDRIIQTFYYCRLKRELHGNGTPLQGTG